MRGFRADIFLPTVPLRNTPSGSRRDAARRQRRFSIRRDDATAATR